MAQTNEVSAITVKWNTPSKRHHGSISRIPIEHVAPEDQSELVVGKIVKVKLGKTWYANQAAVTELHIAEKVPANSSQASIRATTVPLFTPPPPPPTPSTKPMPSSNELRPPKTPPPPIVKPETEIPPQAISDHQQEMLQKILESNLAVAESNRAVAESNRRLAESTDLARLALIDTRAELRQLTDAVKQSHTLSGNGQQVQEFVRLTVEKTHEILKRHFEAEEAQNESEAASVAVNGRSSVTSFADDDNPETDHKPSGAFASNSSKIKPDNKSSGDLSTGQKALQLIGISPSTNGEPPKKRPKQERTPVPEITLSMADPQKICVGDDPMITLTKVHYSDILRKSGDSPVKLLINLLSATIADLHNYTFTGVNGKKSLKDSPEFAACCKQVSKQYGGGTFELGGDAKDAIYQRIAYHVKKAKQPLGSKKAATTAPQPNGLFFASSASCSTAEEFLDSPALSDNADDDRPNNFTEPKPDPFARHLVALPDGSLIVV